MSLRRLTCIAVATVAAAACGAGGLNYWLYPAPRLPESEEAVFVTYESHGLRAIDGEDVGSRCWRDVNQPQAYTRNDVACRLHIQPGEHSVILNPTASSRETVQLNFVAEPGRVYGLDRSNCTTSSLTRDSRSQTCHVEIREVGGAAEGSLDRP